MDRKYWEKIAPTYNEEIFDVLHNDKKGLIRKAISTFASRDKTVIDLGCAIGKWIPVLAPAFKKVIAVDISAENLRIAEMLQSGYKNVEYVRADLSDKKTKLPVCDSGICINAILTGSQKDRDIFFRQLASCIRKGGHVVLAIPSLESYMLSTIIGNQWKIDGHDKKRIPSKKALHHWKNIRQGIADIDSVPHKHYLKEELEILLARYGFHVLEFQKIEYNWDTEFLKPPSWLKNPKPWDWMCVARKTNTPKK